MYKKVYNSKYEQIISKEMLAHDMYELKLPRRFIADKYNVGEGTIQNLQYKYNLEILNIQNRRVPENLTDEQKQIILGTSLADGHLFRKNEKRHAALKIVHSIKQEKYLDYKYDKLQNIVRTKPTIQVSKIKDKTYLCKSFRTLTHSWLTEIHDILYKKSERYIKHITFDILNKVSELGLAIAYMDDGTKHHKARDFCFECFPIEEQQIFCDWIKNKFNVEARPIKYSDRHRIRIIKSSVQRFTEIIKPFVLDSMSYKL